MATADPATAQLFLWRGPCFNCYNHACNEAGTAYFAQPGGGVESFPFNSADIIEKAESDGLVYVDSWKPGDPPPDCVDGCLIAAAIIPFDWPWGDFHWYRRNGDGTWSHKMGEDPARIFRDDGADVVDPYVADRGAYDEFVGYFCVPDGPGPELEAGLLAWEGVLVPRAIEMRYVGLENPAVNLPSSTIVLPHLPTGAPIPDPQWPDHSQFDHHFGGYAFLPQSSAGLPFKYLRVNQGVVAMYADLAGSSITYFQDNNSLGALLQSIVPAVPEWSERFDVYASGPLTGQGGWQPWNDEPSAAGFVVSGQQSRTAPHSLAIDGEDDAVRQYAGVESGAWSYTTWVYIPTAMTDSQYFALLNTYPPIDFGSYSTVLVFDGAASLLRDYGSTTATPLVRGTWSEIRVEFDLNADQQTVLYNGNVLLTDSWSEGTAPGGSLNLAAVDLWGAGSASTVHYDDMRLEAAVSPVGNCPADIAPSSSGGDGVVNVDDMLAIISAWGPCPPPVSCNADITGDFMVNVDDLLETVNGWGPCP